MAMKRLPLPKRWPVMLFSETNWNQSHIKGKVVRITIKVKEMARKVDRLWSSKTGGVCFVEFFIQFPYLVTGQLIPAEKQRAFVIRAMKPTVMVNYITPLGLTRHLCLGGWWGCPVVKGGDPGS